MYTALLAGADHGADTWQTKIPCNIILKRTSPRLWLPTLTIAWGIVATLLGVVQNLAGFFVARFFLGVGKLEPIPLTPTSMSTRLTLLQRNLVFSLVWCTISRCGTRDESVSSASRSSSVPRLLQDRLAVFSHT